MQKNNTNFWHSLVFQLCLSVVLLFSIMISIATYLINQRQTELAERFAQEVQTVTTVTQGINNQVLIIDNAQIQATSEYQVYAFTIIVITIILGSLIFFYIIRKQLHPLNELIDRVSQVDIDNAESLTDGFLVTKGSYEIEELSKTFNHAFLKLYENYEKQKEFSINVAHEVRTPLAVLQSQLHIFKERQKNSSDKDKEIILTLEHHIRRLSEMVESLLFLSRSMSISKNMVGMLDVVEEIFIDLGDIANKKDVQLQLIGDSIILKTDDILLERALFNLVENAIKYNQEGGAVIVELIDESDYAVIKISDTGCGISDQDKQSVFDLFYRVEDSRSRSTGGYGIGLALVLHIVTILKGKIEITDNHPKGTIFSLYLPK